LFLQVFPASIYTLVLLFGIIRAILRVWSSAVRAHTTQQARQRVLNYKYNIISNL